jgi:hypothetical protein
MGNILISQKCHYKGCQSRKIKKSNKLCNLHNCSFDNCDLIIRKDSIYCDRHTCQYQKCNLRVKEGFIFEENKSKNNKYFTYLYCIVHNCQKPHCNNFKKAETKICNQCSKINF